VNETEHFDVDVVVVGAGISGIGAGYHLQKHCPDRSYVILEGRDDIGGTWDLFRYPGVRSDSDMFTLGYSFKPWTEAKAIADGSSILRYLREAVTEFGIDRHIRFRHLAVRAEWSSDTSLWTVEARYRHANNPEQGRRVRVTCNYLFMCSGYYSYKGGYTPQFSGIDRFEGRIVHPQTWPADLDYTGRRVVVIGSGATAMTLVPALAQDAAHVTMLQRSPTYVVSLPDVDPIANVLRAVLPRSWAYALIRMKNVAYQQMVYRRTRTDPDGVKAKLIGMARRELGPDYDVDAHFTPGYNPWDQRLCLLPNGDLFKAIRSGKASVVTGRIDSFTETGVRVASGEELAADIVVTATGLQLVTLGEMDFVVDDAPVDFSRTWSYKGFAYSDIPNLGSSFGYVNASWTLRADLTCEYVCRLLNHMRRTGTTQCTPRLRESDRDMPERPLIQGFSPGYIQRVLHKFPRQGDREPWINPQNYTRDKKMFRKGPLDDAVMRFTTPEMAARARLLNSA
jgi:monooxygenase